MPRSHTNVHTLLLGPPPQVLAEVDAAWERAQDLFAGELELHFELDDITRRVTGELRLPGGGTWEQLSAYEALMLACGDAAIMPAGSYAADALAA
jgi:hypothetical protein